MAVLADFNSVESLLLHAYQIIPRSPIPPIPLSNSFFCFVFDQLPWTFYRITKVGTNSNRTSMYIPVLSSCLSVSKNACIQSIIDVTVVYTSLCSRALYNYGMVRITLKKRHWKISGKKKQDRI